MEDVRAHYRDESKLVKRQALFEFGDPARSHGPGVFDVIDWSGHEVVLDAGCGNGVWTAAVASRVESVVGLDTSLGMLGEVRAKLGSAAALVNADVLTLPFADATFDVVLCFWMLYHVPDHTAALREFSRVLRPQGTLLAVTNSAERSCVDRVVSETLSSMIGRAVTGWPPVLSFNSENGAKILGSVFRRVDRHDKVNALTMPTADPILNSLESMHAVIEDVVGAPIDWDAFVAELRPRLDKHILHNGAYRTESVSSIFVCRR